MKKPKPSRFEKFKVIVLVGFVSFIVVNLPLIAPDATIQCVDCPLPPKLTIVEWVSNQF